MGQDRVMLQLMTAHQDKRPEAPVRQVDPRFFAIVFVPVAIHLTDVWMRHHLMPGDLKVPADILEEGRDWLEAAGRYRFLAATWFYGALSVLAAALLVRTLMRPTASTTRIAAIITFLSVLLLISWPTFNGFGDTDGKQVYAPLGSAVFEAVFERGTLPHCTGPEDTWRLGVCGAVPVLSMFVSVLDVVNIFAGLATGSMIVSMILSLDNRPCKDLEERAVLLAENLRHMRQQLYVSGVILTFAMLFVASWIYWPLPLVEDDERDAYGAVLLSAALHRGTFFSLLMLSFYLPVAIILDGWVKALAEQARRGEAAGDPTDVDKWLDRHGLTAGAGDYMRAGFAVTAPIIAAFAGGISPLAL